MTKAQALLRMMEWFTALPEPEREQLREVMSSNWTSETVDGETLRRLQLGLLDLAAEIHTGGGDIGGIIDMGMMVSQVFMQLTREP